MMSGKTPTDKTRNKMIMRYLGITPINNKIKESGN